MNINKIRFFSIVLFSIIILNLVLINAQTKTNKDTIILSSSNKEDKNHYNFKDIWDAIHDLRQQILILQKQIKNITLIPGPQGPPGPQGIKGTRGLPGPTRPLESSYVLGDKIPVVQDFPEGLKSGLVGYWNMDEGTGAKTKDSTGQNPDGSLNNGVSWSSDCKIGNCTSYNGAGLTNLTDLITTTDSGTYSISFWALSPVVQQNNAVVSAADNSPLYFNGFQVFWGGIGTCSGVNPKLYSQGGYISDGINVQTAPDNCTGPGVLNSSVWHHIVVTYDGSKSSLGINSYIDGVKVSPPYSHIETDSLTGSFNKHALALGGVSSGDLGWSFIGRIDEFGFWNRTLSDTEVSELYNNGNGVSYPRSTNYYSKACCKAGWIRTGCTGQSSLEKPIKPVENECCVSENQELYSICTRYAQ